jgi:hypothetical protein
MDTGRTHAPKRRGSARGQPRSQTRMPWDRARPRAHPPCPFLALRRPRTAALPDASPRGTTPTRSCTKRPALSRSRLVSVRGVSSQASMDKPFGHPPGPSPRYRESPTMSHVMRAMPHPLPWAYSPGFSCVSCISWFHKARGADRWHAGARGSACCRRWALGSHAGCFNAAKGWNHETHEIHEKEGLLARVARVRGLEVFKGHPWRAVPLARGRGDMKRQPRRLHALA